MEAVTISVMSWNGQCQFKANKLWDHLKSEVTRGELCKKQAKTIIYRQVMIYSGDIVMVAKL